MSTVMRTEVGGGGGGGGRNAMTRSCKLSSDETWDERFWS